MFRQPVRWSSSESKWVVSRQLMVLNSGYWPVWSIGHFRVPKTLTFKMRPRAQPFLWKWVLFAWQWKIISISKAEHVNLVLIQRSGGTRKWPIQSRCYQQPIINRQSEETLSDITDWSHAGKKKCWKSATKCVQSLFKNIRGMSPITVTIEDNEFRLSLCIYLKFFFQILNFRG